jgi:hypothetical protein
MKKPKRSGLPMWPPHCVLSLKCRCGLEALNNYLMSFQNAAFKRQAIKLNTPKKSSTQTPS